MVVSGVEQQGEAQRRQSPARIVRKIKIAIDEAEHARVTGAARKHDLTVPAFPADAVLHIAHQVALPGLSDLMHLVAGLTRPVVQVQWVGSNLNQAVAAPNATGQPPGKLLPGARYRTGVSWRLDEAAQRALRLGP
jgi:hypothetical protein